MFFFRQEKKEEPFKTKKNTKERPTQKSSKENSMLLARWDSTESIRLVAWDFISIWLIISFM